MKRGIFVALEGIDGSGKTSLAQGLKRKLDSYKIPLLLTREPGATQIGQQLRAILQHSSEPLSPLTEAFLFAADRTEHIRTIVSPACEEGMVVISDRTYLSSLVYQGYAGKIPLPFLEQINKVAMQSIQIDLVLYLKLSVDEALNRITERGATKTRFESKKSNFLMQAEQGYQQILAPLPHVVQLDATESEEVLIEQAATAIKERYEAA